MRFSFNTQPPEGGWVRFADRLAAIGRFNTQPPEGGWSFLVVLHAIGGFVSTHSRLKAAGYVTGNHNRIEWFQHTAA